MIAIWSFGLGMLVSANSLQNAQAWLAVHYIGAILIPPTFLHYTFELTGASTRIKKQLFFWYPIFLLFLFVNFFKQNLIVQVSTQKPFFRYYTDVAPLYYIYTAAFFLCIAEAFIVQMQALLRKDIGQMRRLQFVYMFAATSFGFLGGATAFFPVFGWHIFPWGMYFVILYPLLMTYAIVRHQLLDIKIIVKKTLVFAGLFTVFMAVVGGVTVISQSFFGRYIHMGLMANGLISVLIAVTLYDPTRRLLINLTDTYLFQKKIDYQHLLRKASQGISRIRSLDQLSRLIVTFLTLRMRIENAAVLTKDADRPVFFLKTCRGYGKQKPRMELLTTDGLVSMLEHERRPIRYEDVLEKLQGRQNLNGIDYDAVKKEMNEIKASLVVPSFRGSVEELSNGTSSLKKNVELVHLLILGKKKSDEPYSEEDVDIFFTIAQESAVAIENARLYDEVIERQHEAEKAREEALAAKRKTEEMELELIRREKAVFVEKLVKGIAHEINNPMHTAGNQIETVEFVLNALREFREAGGAGLSEENLMFLDEQLDSLSKAVVLLNDITGHVAKITETLNTMQRPEDDSIQKIDFKTYWVAAVPMIEAQSHGDLLNSVPIKVNIQRGLPLIKANSSQLTQIFLNLYRNSLYALRGRDNKTVVLRAEPDPDDKRLLKITFEDNGCGIPANVLPKIFDYMFTTKGKEGHGIGLNMCRMMLERFGGSLTCESEEGTGTKFIIRLKFEHD